MKATEFVKMACNDVVFEICYENEWSDELTKEEALKFIEQANAKDDFPHNVIYWSTSVITDFLVYFEI